MVVFFFLSQEALAILIIVMRHTSDLHNRNVVLTWMPVEQQWPNCVFKRNVTVAEALRVFLDYSLTVLNMLLKAREWRFK